MNALESSLGSHSMLSRSKCPQICTDLNEHTEDTEFEITTSPNLLRCSYATMYPESLSTLRLTLSWVCLIKRNEIKSHIALSTGNWIGDAFRLHRLEIIDWSDRSSTKMLGHAMVAGLDYIIPKAPLL